MTRQRGALAEHRSQGARQRRDKSGYAFAVLLPRVAHHGKVHLAPRQRREPPDALVAKPRCVLFVQSELADLWKPSETFEDPARSCADPALVSRPLRRGSLFTIGPRHGPFFFFEEVICHSIILGARPSGTFADPAGSCPDPAQDL